MAEKKDERNEENEEESIAGDILEGIGGMIPGLGGLLKGIEQSPAFKERLKRVDEEVEQKLREEPHIPRGMPPRRRGKTAGGRLSSRKKSTRGKSKGPPPAPEERPVDIFDEKNYIKIIAEVPGVEGKDIKVNLKNDMITIKVDASNRKYYQELKLPCKPEGEIEKSYKNGILEIVIKK